MTDEVIRLILGGSLLTALGGGFKYLIDVARQDRRDKAPLSVASAMSEASQSSIEMLSRMNTELSEENARLRLIIEQHVARECTYRLEINQLQERMLILTRQVIELNNQLADLSDSAPPGIEGA